MKITLIRFVIKKGKNMKLIESVICILFLLFCFNIYAQTYDPIQDLYSEDVYLNMTAAVYIIDNNIVEAYPIVIQLYDTKPLIVKSHFLDVLNKFNDPNIVSRCSHFIEELDNASNDDLKFLDILSEKNKITYILFSHNDYSTANYIFDIINREGISNISGSTFQLLQQLIEFVPAYKIQAKQILMNILQSPNQNNRAYILDYLSRKFGIEMINILRDYSGSDDPVIRITALQHLLVLDKENANDLLKTRLIQESAWAYRVDIADSILLNFGTPSDLKYVTDYEPNEPNSTAKSLMAYSVSSFIPPRPEKSTREILHGYLIDDIILPLIDYEWISPSISYDYAGAVQELLEIMDSSQPFDYEQFCNLLSKEIIPQIDKDFENNELTIEGYKFLHYNFIYLLDQFNEEFQQNCSM